MRPSVLLLMIYAENMVQHNEEPGICYIASYIRKQGYSAKMMSFHADNIDWQAIVDYDPEIIGMPIYNVSRKKVLTVVKELKERIDKTKVCLGGYEATFDHDQLMKECPDIDYIIRGEGEQAFFQLLQAMERKLDFQQVCNLVYRDGKKVKINPMSLHPLDLQSIPWMARDFLKNKQYHMAIISGSRGCTGRCSFCVTGAVYKKWRGRTAKDIINEVEYIQNHYDIHVFYFIDCSFENPGQCRERVENIAREILERGLIIHYFVFFRADFVQSVDMTFLELLKKSGLYCAILGIEAANPECLKLYQKTASVFDNERAIETFRQAGIYVEMGFIMFNPYVSLDGLKKNIQFLKKYEAAFCVDYVLARFSMYKGCSLTEKIYRDKLVIDSQDIYGYQYLEKNISLLASFAVQYFRDLYIYTGYDMTKLHDHRINFEYMRIICNENEKLYQLISQYKPVTDDMVAELNERIATWFSELICLAQTEWSNQKANEISQQIIPREYLCNTYQNMSTRINQFYVKLKRLNIRVKNNPYVIDMN